jgi:hypothetical protein
MARQNPFQQLRFLCEGPEGEFEALCANLIRTQYPDTKRVRVHKGDGGVDAAHGEWGTHGTLDVFQVKYFPDVLGDSQRQKIRESYETAHTNQNFRLRKWTLCLPALLRQEDHHWFDTWKDKQDTHIELWDGDKLEQLLGLPAASRSRERLITLRAVGTPSAAPVLEPKLRAQIFDKSQGTGFQLRIDLTNSGDQAADNVRLIVSHTRETHHRANGPFPPWKHENQEYGPWILSLQRSLNSGETIPVIYIPFGITAPLHGRIGIEITSRTTGLNKWYAEATAQDITNSSHVQFIADAPPWPKDAPKQTNTEPQFGPAKAILDKIHENQDSDTRGLTEILIAIPGQIGATGYHPTTAIYGQHQLAYLDKPVAELVALGWLKEKGVGMNRRQYTLVKERDASSSRTITQQPIA